MSLRMCLTNNIIPTSVGVNTFRTIVLLTLTTNCDGGALVATQCIHYMATSPLPSWAEIVWWGGGGVGGEWSNIDAPRDSPLGVGGTIAFLPDCLLGLNMVKLQCPH